MSFSSLGASDGPLDEDLDAETLSALDDALLTYYNGVGSTKSDGVFLLSEHGVACLNSLTTLLRDDSARSQPAHFRLGSWSFAAERAVPAIMAYRDRPDVLFAVLRAMVRLTGPLGGDLKHEVAERVRQQQRMKLAFASKDVISALILPLQAPLDAWAAEGGSLAAVPAQQLHYLECLLAVIRNLLSIDNDSGDGGSRSGGASGAHLHDRLVLALSDAVFFPVLGTVILLVLTKGSKNEYLSLLCLEIVYRVLLRESPEDLFPPPPPAHAMAEAAAAKARAAAAAAAAAGASAKAPSGSPLSRSSSGSGSASASASSAAAPGAAPGSSGAPLARSHSASVSSRIAELSARLSASSAAAAATAAAARARAGAPGGGGGSAGRASIAVLSGGIAGPRQVTTLDDLFANTHNSRKDMDLVEKVGGLPIILARGPRMYLHARARDAYRSVLALLLAPVSASSEACMAAASGGAAGPAGPENSWGAIIPCLPFEEAKDTLFNAFLGYTYQKIVSLAQLDVSGGLDVAERAAALRDPLHWLHLAWLGLGCVRTHHDAVRARHAAATAPARKQWAQEQKAAAKAAAVARGAPKAEIDAIDKKRGWESANGGPPGLPPAPRYCFAPAAKVCEDELFNYVLRRLQSAMTDKPVRWEGVERATAALGEIVRSYVCAVSEGDAVTKANAATTRESVIRDEATFTTVRKVIQFYNPTKNGPEHRDRVLVLIHCAYKALELAGGSAGAVTVRGRERTVTVTKKIKKSKAEVEAAAAAAAAAAGDDDDDDDEEAAQAKLAAEVAAEAEAEAAAGTATGAGAAEDNGDDAAAAAMKSLKKLAAAAANSNSNENMADDDDVDEIGSSSSSSKRRRMLDDASSEDDDDEKEAKSTQKGTQPAADMSDDEGPPPPRRPHSRSQSRPQSRSQSRSRSRSRSKSRSKNNDDGEERKNVADGGDDNDDDDGDNDEDSSKKNKSKKKAKKDKEVVVEVIKTKERVHSLLTFGPEQFTESLAQPQVLRQYVEAAESYRTNLPFVNESVFKFLSRVAFDSGRAAMLYNVFTVFLAEEVLNDPLTRRDPSLYRAHDFCRRFAASFLAATARNPLVWVESLSWMTAQTAEFAANPEKYVLENMDRVAEAMEVLQETQGLLTGGSFDPDTQAVVDRVAREEGEEEAAAFAAYIRKTQAESLALSKKKIRKNRGRGGRGGGDGDDDDYIDTFDPSRVGTGAYDDDDDDEYISPAVRALLQRAPGGTASGRSDRAAGRNDSSSTGGEVTGAALAAAGLTRARGRRRDDDEEEVVDVEEALAKARVEAAAKKAAKDAKEAAKAAAAAAKVARKAAAEAKKAEKEERKRQKIAEKRAKRAAQGKNVDESSDGEPDGLSSSSDDEGEAASVESDDDGASAAAAAVVDDDDEEESGFKDKKSSKKDKKDKKSKDKSKSKSKSSKGKDNEEDDAELRRSLQAELALLAQARAASGAESSTGAGAGAGAGRGLKSPLRPSSGNHDDDDDNDGGSVVEEKTAKAGSVKRRRLVGAAFGSGDSPSASATAADAGASAKVDSDDDADVGAAPARRRKVILDDDDDE